MLSKTYNFNNKKNYLGDREKHKVMGLFIVKNVTLQFVRVDAVVAKDTVHCCIKESKKTAALFFQMPNFFTD